MALLSLALALTRPRNPPYRIPRRRLPSRPDLFKRIIANQKKDESAMDLYERVERVETRKNSSDPNPPVVKVSRVIPSGTGMYKIASVTMASQDALHIAQAMRPGASAGSSSSTTADHSATPWRSTQRGKKDRNDLIDARTMRSSRSVSTNSGGDHTLSKYKMDPNPAFRPQRASLPSFPKCAASCGSKNPPVNLPASRRR